MARIQQRRAGRKSTNLHDGTIGQLQNNITEATKKRGVYLGHAFFLYPKTHKKQINALDSYDYDQLNNPGEI